MIASRVRHERQSTHPPPSQNPCRPEACLCAEGSRPAHRFPSLIRSLLLVPLFTLAAAASTLNAANFPGPDWLAKVSAAAASLPHGGSIEVPDSIAGKSGAAAIPSNITLEFSGSATFILCRIAAGPFSKILGHGAQLQIAGSDCTGIEQNHPATLQSRDKFVIEGLRLDCNHQPGSTGILIGGNHAQTVLRDVTIADCTNAGLRLEGGQFGEYANVSLYNNFVGLKIYTTDAGGGGNSNTFYGLKAVANTVGVLIAEDARFGMGPNYFLNPSLLSNSVAAMAVFGHSGASEVHWYGGAPEANGGGAELIAIDGHLVKQATLYGNRARITLTEVEIEEAKINPVVRGENFSSITLNNVSGYGRWDGTLVSADSTSTTLLQGRLEVLGTIENVISYPAGLASSAYVRLSGAAVMTINPEIPNAYPGNALAPHPADIRGSLSTGQIRDLQLGAVSVVRHAARRGNQEHNRVNFGNLLASPPAVESSLLLSLLLKASEDCTYVVEEYGDGYTAVHVPLIAKQWTRVMIYQGHLPPGKAVTLVGWPDDAAGAAVSFSGLQVLLQPLNSFELRGFMDAVLTTGAVNPNQGADLVRPQDTLPLAPLIR